MTYACDARYQPAQPVLSIRTHSPVGNLPQVLGQCFGKVIEYIVSLNEQPAGAPFVCYYNMDMQNLDIEIGFPVAVTLPRMTKSSRAACRKACMPSACTRVPTRRWSRLMKR